MRVGMIGLGKMSPSMERRLTQAGHECVAHDISAAAVHRLAEDHQQYRPSRWMILCGNSHYVDDIRRAKALKPRGIHCVDSGTSGSLRGRERGSCQMIGGESQIGQYPDSDFQLWRLQSIRCRVHRGERSNRVEVLPSTDICTVDVETTPLREPELYQYYFDLILNGQIGVNMPRYQRLPGDAMRGNSEMFAREDFAEAQWRAVEPILGNVMPLHRYDPGRWGPVEAARLIGGDGPCMVPQQAG